MTINKIAQVLFACFLLTVFVYPTSGQSPIAQTDLEIRGMALEVVNPSVEANLDTPSYVQTRFGGQVNDEVPQLPAGLIVKGDLTGPGLATPITLQTAPGRAFQLPGLSPVGTYYLQNIRLENQGQFVQPAAPSLAIIRVVDAFKTEVKIRQLTPEELRQRGISIDSSNYDVYGALTKETKPDGAVVNYAYDALGVPTGYTDPTNETTTTTTDLIGRPTLRTYPDGTAETWTYNGPRLESHTDRQGRTRAVDYNDKGQVIRIRGNNNVVLELIDYDDAGRVTRRRNKDAAVEYDDVNLAGQPRKTRQIRYADGTGIIASPIVIDSYEQTHEWNEHGERTGFTMPSYPGLALYGGWTKSLAEQHDAMGNLTTIDRTLWSGATQTMMSATFRNAGRPDIRTIITSPTSAQSPAPSSITRQYGYDPATGQLNAMRVASEGLEVVGSVIKYDGVQRAEAVLVGLSGGERSNQWGYDARGRLATSSHAKKTESAKAIEKLTPSDFRTELDRPETTDASPKSISFTESSAGHKIEEVTKGETTRDIAWDGSEMVDDGTFVYEFDTYGRLVMVTEKSTEGPSSLSVRRIKYTYTPTNRLVGRRAEYAPIPSAGAEPLETDWRLENRPDILSADALPAETTFVWNPFADTIDSLFVAGASEQVGLPNGGLVRQIIHGGLSYDDPIEVTAVDPNSIGGALTRLYPVYDEAGAGMLQAILNASGEMVARTFADGAYGEAEYALPGPAVDRIAVSASKDEIGALTEVEITLRLTEQIDEATLGNGLRLAALAADGSVLRTSDATPTLTNNWTAGWTLTAGEWNALVDGAASISIAATNTLRAARWADTPVLAVPDWATSSKPVFSSATLPVEARESVTALGEWITGVSADSETTVALYEVPDLAAIAGSQDLAGDPRKLLVAATFHAHPFHESLTGKNYVRARWYAPELGNFISPDPMGYQDSSNLYAFCGGDPVNCSDPTGLEAYWEKRSSEIIQDLRGFAQIRDQNPGLYPIYVDDVLALKRELKALLEDRPEEDPNAPKKPGLLSRLLSKRAEVEETFEETGAGLGRLATPLSHRQSDDVNQEAAALIGAQEALMQERATRVQNEGFRPAAEGVGRRAGQLTYAAGELLVLEGSGKFADELATVATPWGTKSRTTGKFVGGVRRGIDPVDDFIAHAKASGFEVVGREVYVQTPFGVRRLDVVLRNPATGHVGGVEIKSTMAEFEKFLSDQFAKDTYINKHGGIAFGEQARKGGISQVESVVKIMWAGPQ